MPEPVRAAGKVAFRGNLLFEWMTGKHRTRPPYVRSKIINTLRAAEGREVTRQDLIAAMYEADGGADSAEGVLRMSICKLRKMGYPIKRTSRGYAYAPTQWEVQP